MPTPLPKPTAPPVVPPRGGNPTSGVGATPVSATPPITSTSTTPPVGVTTPPVKPAVSPAPVQQGSGSQSSVQLSGTSAQVGQPGQQTVVPQKPQSPTGAPGQAKPAGQLSQPLTPPSSPPRSTAPHVATSPVATPGVSTVPSPSGAPSVKSPTPPPTSPSPLRQPPPNQAAGAQPPAPPMATQTQQKLAPQPMASTTSSTAGPAGTPQSAGSTPSGTTSPGLRVAPPVVAAMGSAVSATNTSPIPKLSLKPQSAPPLQPTPPGAVTTPGSPVGQPSTVITPVVGRPLPGAPQPSPAATAVKTPQAPAVTPPGGGTPTSVVVAGVATPPGASGAQGAAAPPQSVTALSSVSPNQLPAGANKQAAPLPPSPTAPQEVQFAKPKRSWFTLIPIVIGVLLVLLVGVFAFLMLNKNNSSSDSTSPTGVSKPSASAGKSGTSNSGSSGAATTGEKKVLQYWGLWEPTDTMKEILDSYQKDHPNISIQYTKQSHLDYRSRLQNAVASGNGPDIFRYHSTWVPMLKNELSPLPSAVMSSSEFQQTFFPTTTKLLQNNGTPVGIPLMHEGLALFYNTEVFSTAVKQPPTTWGELRQLAKDLTVVEGTSIKRAGIAMGLTSNVDHFSDIVALLSLQNGADLSDPSGKETVDALTFYTLFASDKVWDASLPNSTVAFARGDVAMIFAPSWRALEIKQMNPNLKFATAPVPQLDSNEKITWANFWAEGVSSKSKNSKEAWEFLDYLSSKEVQQKLFNAQSQVRPFGEIYSRVDLSAQLASDPILGAFLTDAPKATGWFMSSNTHDKGINDEIIKYYENGINEVLDKQSVEDVVETLSSGVRQVLLKYQVPIESESSTGAGGSTTKSSGSSGDTVGF